MDLCSHHLVHSNYINMILSRPNVYEGIVLHFGLIKYINESEYESIFKLELTSIWIINNRRHSGNENQFEFICWVNSFSFIQIETVFVELVDNWLRALSSEFIQNKTIVVNTIQSIINENISALIKISSMYMMISFLIYQ